MAARDDDERKRLLREEEGLAVKKLPKSASRLMRRSEQEEGGERCNLLGKESQTFKAFRPEGENVMTICISQPDINDPYIYVHSGMLLPANASYGGDVPPLISHFVF